MLTLRYKAHFFAGEQLLKVSDFKNMPVFKAKQLVKEEYLRNGKVTAVKLYAYGFEKRMIYKLSCKCWSVVNE